MPFSTGDPMEALMQLLDMRDMAYDVDEFPVTGWMEVTFESAKGEVSVTRSANGLSAEIGGCRLMASDPRGIMEEALWGGFEHA